MAKMRAVDAAVRVLEKEGISTAFGVPGAAINPLYSALRKRGSIRHILARHVEGASHMAEGYTRAKGKGVRLWNLTTETISGFQLAPAGKTDWGPNQCLNDKDKEVDHDERLAKAILDRQTAERLQAFAAECRTELSVLMLKTAA